MSSLGFDLPLDLFTTIFVDWRTGTLAGILVIAAITDIHSHRVPNWLVLGGILFGTTYNTIYPLAFGDTILASIAGIGVGLLLFLPLYALRTMGAGDVKLLAMVGAFVGPGATLRVAVLSIIAGGVLAILFVLVKGTAPRLIQNLRSVLQLSFLNVSMGAAPNLHIAPEKSAGKLPFAVAILIGTLSYLVLRQLIF